MSSSALWGIHTPSRVLGIDWGVSSPSACMFFSSFQGQGLSLGLVLGWGCCWTRFSCVYEGFRSLGWEELFEWKGLELVSFGIRKVGWQLGSLDLLSRTDSAAPSTERRWSAYSWRRKHSGANICAETLLVDCSWGVPSAKIIER